jgi:hypothetical protein
MRGSGRNHDSWRRAATGRLRGVGPRLRLVELPVDGRDGLAVTDGARGGDAVAQAAVEQGFGLLAQAALPHGRDASLDALVEHCPVNP